MNTTIHNIIENMAKNDPKAIEILLEDFKRVSDVPKSYGQFVREFESFIAGYMIAGEKAIAVAMKPCMN